MQTAGYNSYREANVSTADRGKLIIMIYDHCLKWCKIASEHMSDDNIEAAVKAVFRVQDGITELTCALDMDGGGEIVHNLFNLYQFYSHHLSTAINKKDRKPIEEVADMMSELRKAWLQAIDTVRREDRTKMREDSGNQLKMVG